MKNLHIALFLLIALSLKALASKFLYHLIIIPLQRFNLEHDVVGEVFSHEKGPGKRAVAFSLAKNLDTNLAVTEVIFCFIFL